MPLDTPGVRFILPFFSSAARCESLAALEAQPNFSDISRLVGGYPLDRVYVLMYSRTRRCFFVSISIWLVYCRSPVQVKPQSYEASHYCRYILPG